MISIYMKLKMDMIDELWIDDDDTERGECLSHVRPLDKVVGEPLRDLYLRDDEEGNVFVEYENERARGEQRRLGKV